MTEQTGRTTRLAVESGPKTGILLIDLDGLKHVNDLRGHGCGDALLRQFARALTKHVDPSGFRMGGDKYVMLRSASQLEAVVQQVRSAGADIQLLDFPEIDASLGCAWGQEVPESSALLVLADQRMYREKHALSTYQSQTLEVSNW